MSMPPSKSGAFPISNVGVVIGYQTKKGIEEVVHQVDGDDVTITSCTHEVVKKMRQVKEEGQVVGFEPTGEETLILKVKYIRE
jgi:hypothetical protein